MYPQHYIKILDIKTLEFQPNIPLLDRDFDEKSTEISDFIFSLAQTQNENSYTMGFKTQLT